jgi:ABC-2 type transport system permease protein
MATVSHTGTRRAVAAPPEPSAEQRAPLAGTWTLVRFMLRRDRVRLPAWTAGLALFAVYVATAIPAAYPSEADLRGAVSLFADPVGRMLVGPAYGFEVASYERFVAGGYGLYFLILVALMSLLLITRHTRVEEQTGRAELVAANVVGRYAALTGALVVALVANAVVAVALFVVLLAVGYGTAGSLLFAAGVGVTGLAFAGLAAVTVQLTEYSRAAAGMAGGVLGAAFVIRAGGDMAEVGGNALSWFSPLAWAQQTAPFVLDRWWPLLLPLAFATVTSALGYRLSTRRDLGASLFAVRPGNAEAPAWLGSPLTLALRLQRASILGWSAAMLAAGVSFGSFADAMLAAAEGMPEAFLELFGDGEMLVAGYLGYMAVFMAYLVGVYAILSLQHLRSEETSGRGEPVLATPVGRVAWLGSHLLVTTAGVVIVLVMAGIGTGIGAAIVTGDAGHVWELAVAHLNQVPAVLVVLGLAALLFGLAPRLIALSWSTIGYALVVGTFGVLMDLPSAAFEVSPFEHLAAMPADAFAATPVVVLTAIALAMTAVGLWGFRRRDLDGI